MQLSGRPENIEIYLHLRNRQSTECNNYRVARLKFLSLRRTLALTDTREPSPSSARHRERHSVNVEPGSTVG
jgi:hypothetical protein